MCASLPRPSGLPPRSGTLPMMICLMPVPAGAARLRPETPCPPAPAAPASTPTPRLSMSMADTGVEVGTCVRATTSAGRSVHTSSSTTCRCGRTWHTGYGQGKTTQAKHVVRCGRAWHTG